mmetsp:Transcript_32784/g.37172  ORF Transcript_32784/g.37172 Transcript_32784/m.37172 type:complete len:235 (+) Transcript_32784:65-769(+)
MNEEEARRTVDQMAKFILQEADDKSKEIESRALEEYDIEKTKIIQASKVKTHAEYDKKRKQFEVTKKIARSNAINATKLRKMEARNQGIENIIEEARLDLAANVTKDKNAYKKLLKELIVESWLRIDEREIKVRCRKEDQSLVEGVLEDAKKDYLDLLEDATGTRPTGAKIALNKESYLPPGPKKGEEGLSCCGGIELSAYTDRLKCNNTLDHRLSLCFSDSIPLIRSTLFPDL